MANNVFCAILKSAGIRRLLSIIPIFGGSRPGKTTVLVMAVIYRDLRFAGSRHVVYRYRAKKETRSSEKLGYHQ
ncbi:MAG: hypothetical protein LBL76_11565 [Treponema sp.]|jgi:hypothetical protein|nr:hypothetical protein [Treponema sp.]